MRLNDGPLNFELAPRFADSFGSLFEIVGAVAGAVLGGPVGAGIGTWLGGAIDGWLGGSGGGAGSGNDDAQNAVDEVLQSVTHSQSHRTITETTTTRSSLFERTLSRTFTNPYRDRSLQLRLIPVFRRFEVITSFFQFHHGITVQVLAPQFKKAALSARLGDFIQKSVTDPRIVAVASAELGLQDAVTPTKAAKPASALTEHLNANAEFYAKQYLQHLHERRDFAALHPVVLNAVSSATRGNVAADEMQHAFVWSRTAVRGKTIYVPLAGEVAAKALKMQKGEKPYLDALRRIEEFRLKPLPRKRNVHLFMGTHIEPVAGECVLQNLPAA